MDEHDAPEQEAQEGPPAPSRTVPSLLGPTGLSQLVGIHKNHIYKHIHRAGLQPVRAQLYSVREVLEAIKKHRENDNRNRTPDTPRTRKLNLEADLLQAKLNALIGNLIPAEEVAGAWELLVVNFRQRILTVPRKLAPALAVLDSVPAIEAALKAELAEALAELSAFPANSQSPPTSGSPSSTPAGPHPFRMGRPIPPPLE